MIKTITHATSIRIIPLLLLFHSISLEGRNVEIKWKSVEGAKHYNLAIKNFEKEMVRKTIKSLRWDGFLSPGIYQYQLQAIAVDDKEGKITRETLEVSPEAPTTIAPNSESKLIYSQGKETIFEWNEVNGATYYEFILYMAGKQFLKRLVYGKSLGLKLKIENYEWTLSAITETKNLSKDEKKLQSLPSVRVPFRVRDVYEGIALNETTETDIDPRELLDHQFEFGAVSIHWFPYQIKTFDPAGISGETKASAAHLNLLISNPIHERVGIQFKINNYLFRTSNKNELSRSIALHLCSYWPLSFFDRSLFTASLGGEAHEYLEPVLLGGSTRQGSYGMSPELSVAKHFSYLSVRAKFGLYIPFFLASGNQLPHLYFGKTHIELEVSYWFLPRASFGLGGFYESQLLRRKSGSGYNELSLTSIGLMSALRFTL